MSKLNCDFGMNPTAPPRSTALLAPELTAPHGDVRAGVVSLLFGPGPDGAVGIRLRRATVTVDEVTVVNDGRLAGGFEPDVYEELG